MGECLEDGSDFISPVDFVQRNFESERASSSLDIARLPHGIAIVSVRKYR